MTDTTFEKAVYLREKLERVLAAARGEIFCALSLLEKNKVEEAKRILQGLEKALR